MKVLGINDGHNAAACLYEDGPVSAAVQEERLRRVKNWSGMPSGAIRTVLGITASSPDQVDPVAVSARYAVRIRRRCAILPALL